MTGGVRALLARLRGRGRLAGLRGRGRLDARLRPPLEREERILAWARTTDGRPVVATNRGLWLPSQPPRRTNWHEIHKVTWSDRELAVTPANAVTVTPTAAGTPVAADGGAPVATDGGAPLATEAGGAMAADGYRVMVDAPTVTCSLEEPGRLPEHVRTRVNRSIADTRHHALPGGGGVRVVARRVSGVDGLLWTVRYDEGTDACAPEVIAETGTLVAAARAELAAR